MERAKGRNFCNGSNLRVTANSKAAVGEEPRRHAPETDAATGGMGGKLPSRRRFTASGPGLPPQAWQAVMIVLAAYLRMVASSLSLTSLFSRPLRTARTKVA